MKGAFNIKVGYGEKEVTFTILPTSVNYFKVIYFGGVRGAVCFNGDQWDLIERDKVEPGDLPLYEPDLKGERLPVILNETTLREIVLEIESYFSQNDEG